MSLYYFIPIILIAVGLIYSKWMAKRNHALFDHGTPEERAEIFHQSFSAHFEVEEGERIIGYWSGLEFQGVQSTARKVAGAALNKISAEAIGVSVYVPTVEVVLTSRGRLLVAREHSELGERGYFDQILSFGPGVSVLGQRAAGIEQDLGKPPRDPSNPLHELEFVQLHSSEGEVYEIWISPSGSKLGHNGFISLTQAVA